MSDEPTTTYTRDIRDKHGKLLTTVKLPYYWRNRLHDTDLVGRHLPGADFRGLEFHGVRFKNAHLDGADFTGCHHMVKVDFAQADLVGAVFRGAGLDYCTLTGADARGANFTGARLTGCDLFQADLSGAKGLLDPCRWMADNFGRDAEGYLVYKVFGCTPYAAPDRWRVARGAVLTEVANPDRTTDCGCGVNFATEAWCRDSGCAGSLWLCRLRWKDLPGLVVPYGTDGKARCTRLELVRRVDTIDVEFPW